MHFRARLLIRVIVKILFGSLSAQLGATSGMKDIQQDTNIVTNDTIVNWPSLHFYFRLKRKYMGFHGRLKFSVFANPDVSTDHVLYDFYTTFHDPTTVYNYTLVDGIAHLQSTDRNYELETSSIHCLRTELSIVPPINAIVSAINDAVPVSLSGNMSDTIQCNSGSIYKVSVRDFDFALCVSEDMSFNMYGSNMDIKVKHLDQRVTIIAPKSNTNSDGKCKAIVSASPITSIGRSLLTGTTVPEDKSRKLMSIYSFLFDDDPSCNCKSKRRHCIFIHGLGVSKEDQNNVDKLSYWGKISGHTPCCLTTKFAHLETTGHSWMQGGLQKKVCNHALAVSKSSSDATIRDTIIITHSMGTLTLAAAVANGTCEVDSSSTWVSAAAPLRGSMGSDYIQQSCQKGSGLFESIKGYITEKEAKCPPSTAMKSLSYEHEAYSSAHLNRAYKIVQKVYATNVSAAMCSDSYSGLFTSYQAKFWILGTFLPHKSSENDGTVEFQSCVCGFPELKFQPHYKNAFYRTHLNHYDMQFRGGDALLDKAKMPLKWFECLL